MTVDIGEMCFVSAVAMITSWSRCDIGVALSGESGFLTSVRQAAASMSEPLAASAAAAAGRCRWNITVAPGRTVNVTLFDFGVASRRRPIGDNGDHRRSRLVTNDELSKIFGFT